MVETKDVTKTYSSAYASGMYGRSLWLPEIIDASQFKGGDEMARIRSANATNLQRRMDYQRGLLEYLKNHGIVGSDAKTIANRYGIEGFNLALQGQPRPAGIHVDSERMIGELAQKGARAINSASCFRQRRWVVGSRIAGSNKQNSATARVA